MQISGEVEKYTHRKGGACSDRAGPELVRAGVLSKPQRVACSVETTMRPTNGDRADQMQAAWGWSPVESRLEEKK